uniref:Uncharacterized protein n=1 Tax=viral metagenome TaxID=1070528 RepID=A0A6C0HR28_9ZZZZ
MNVINDLYKRAVSNFRKENKRAPSATENMEIWHDAYDNFFEEVKQQNLNKNQTLTTVNDFVNKK